MILKNKIIILGVKKKTKAKFFDQLGTGDILELLYDLNGCYGYSPYIKIIKTSGESINNSALQLRSNLSNFEYEDLEEEIK